MLLVTPAILAPVLIAAVFLGFYVADAYGYSRPLLAIAFSAVGLLVSMAAIVKLAGRIAAQGRA